jgi:AcrR family transcriptional regulator
MPRLSTIRKQAIDGIMKEALFEATVAVLSEHGVDELTMDRVASEAGIAKGSLYRYFHSKRDLLEFIYAKLIDPIFQNLEAVVAKQQPAIEKLNEELRGLLEHIAHYGQVHMLLFENEAAHALLQSTERRTLEAASQKLAEIFRQGIKEETFRPGDPLMLANMYLGLCKGVLQSKPNLDAPEQREMVHRLILDTFLNGIVVRKEL